MKKVIMTLAVLMLAATSAQAQTSSDDTRAGKGGKHRGDPVARLTQALDLSDDQAMEVSVILEESRDQHRAIQESVQAEHCAVRQNTHDQLSTVLTEEQMTKFEQMKTRRMNRGRHEGMPRFANCET
ncbi:MAG TPA: hypothetical protein VJ984_01865 [Xanthomonadales bacterium]|nr:hypothetical protein [Xanthomonadales bacterium]